MGLYLYCHLCDLHHELKEEESLESFRFIEKHSISCRTDCIGVVERHFFDNNYFWSEVEMDNKMSIEAILKRIESFEEDGIKSVDNQYPEQVHKMADNIYEMPSLDLEEARALRLKDYRRDYDKKREASITCFLCKTVHDYQGCPECGWDPDERCQDRNYIKNKEKIGKIREAQQKLSKLTTQFEKEEMSTKEMCEKLVEEGIIISYKLDEEEKTQ